uniref:Uncharacterized protein n=1 Tax=Parascaris univalens TaxID=6257 RepID=A0A915A407_PARUN
MVVSPTQTSPSFVYSPVASPPCQVLYPFGVNVDQATQSIIGQEPMGYTPATYCAHAGVPQIDMRHYSQMNPLVTSPPYFLPANAVAIANTNGQPITVSTPINHSVAQEVRPESTQGQRFSGELLPSGWHGRPAEVTAPLRRPISSMNLLRPYSPAWSSTCQ